ncbi:hypothetical protein CDV36_001719 [Fusarium kuroshium]|uniref:Uncharacterized protein n=1 Tax=Fusarium kuroshium TaxID=2010991 RepID=A0A3M2SM51_9HYPO|nr:hypothetical protein CDV36_001719 [Fusarium kuroshium]
MSDATPLLSRALLFNQTSPSSDVCEPGPTNSTLPLKTLAATRVSLIGGSLFSVEGSILLALVEAQEDVDSVETRFRRHVARKCPITPSDPSTIHSRAHEMHMAFTLTQKRRARDKTAKRYNKFVAAAENVWPKSTGSIATLVRRTLAWTGIIGSIPSRFVLPRQTSPACDVPPFMNKDAPPSHSRPDDAPLLWPPESPAIALIIPEGSASEPKAPRVSSDQVASESPVVLEIPDSDTAAETGWGVESAANVMQSLSQMSIRTMWPPTTTSIPSARDALRNGLPPFTVLWGDWPQDHPLAAGQGAGQALGHSDGPAPHDADEED